MRIKQYTYFGIDSQETHPDTITARVGIEPDEVRLRGSRHASPPGPRPVPRSHIWQVRCDERGLTVTEQIDRVMERVGPRRSALRALVESADDVRPRLVVVRSFDDEEGEEEDGEDYGKLAGQHQLLGFDLSPEVLSFVLEVHAEFYFDEYG